MPALVAFDLDGVLYSSEAYLGQAYAEAMSEVGKARPGALPHVPTTREILDHVGWPLSTILERLFPGLDGQTAALLDAEVLRTICGHVSRGEGKVFPGVPETLDRLRRSGHALFVASNGRRAYVEAVLDAHELRRFFPALITVDRVRFHAKAELLRAYLERETALPRHLVMVGDRASDVEAANAVGCRFVGCDYGHGYRDEIEAAGPVVSAFERLPDVIDEIMARN